jgi:hypothetical protein
MGSNRRKRLASGGFGCRHCFAGSQFDGWGDVDMRKVRHHGFEFHVGTLKRPASAEIGLVVNGINLSIRVGAGQSFPEFYSRSN